MKDIECPFCGIKTYVVPYHYSPNALKFCCEKCKKDFEYSFSDGLYYNEDGSHLSSIKALSPEAEEKV